jgi:F-type H+-transporting ATPase subunit b
MLVLIELMAAAPVLASEEGGGGGDLATTPIGWTFRIINFGILIFLGYRMLRGAPQWFRARAEKIVGAIAESQQIKEEADRLVQDSERRLAGLDQEVGALRAGARQDATAETERIRATAREEQIKVEHSADAEIAAAERAARLELKALVAQLAVQRAEELLKDKVTPDRQAALLRGFVQNLGSVN